MVHKHTRGLGWFDTWFSGDHRGEEHEDLLVHGHFSIRDVGKCGPFSSPGLTSCFTLQFFGGTRHLILSAGDLVGT